MAEELDFFYCGSKCRLTPDNLQVQKRIDAPKLSPENLPQYAERLRRNHHPARLSALLKLGRELGEFRCKSGWRGTETSHPPAPAGGGVRSGAPRGVRGCGGARGPGGMLRSRQLQVLGLVLPPEQGHARGRARPLPSKCFSDGFANGLPLEEQSGDGAGGAVHTTPGFFLFRRAGGGFLRR